MEPPHHQGWTAYEVADRIALPISFKVKSSVQDRSPGSARRTVFIDTEFTTLEWHERPWLLSLAMVSDDGIEFYAEVDLSSDTAHLARSSEFVKTVVLSQFCLAPGRSMSPTRLALEATEWLEGIASDAGIDVVHDAEWDFEFLSAVVQKGGSMGAALQPMDVGSLLCGQEDEAARASFSVSLAQGLRKHHALADARALRARFMAFERRCRQQVSETAP